MNSVITIQWNVDEATSGYSQDFVWSLAVRNRCDEELNELLETLEKEGTCLVEVKDGKDISSLFYFEWEPSSKLAIPN